MPAYLTTPEFKSLTAMPSTRVDDLESVAAGYLSAQLTHWSSWIDSRLRKRYAAPFASPYPEAVKLWLAMIVTPICWIRIGVDPNDPQWASVTELEKSAKEQVLEAANSETGLFDLPLRQDTTDTGISKGGPLAYSEQSPYAWTDRQRETGRNEDAAGEGTTS